VLAEREFTALGTADVLRVATLSASCASTFWVVRARRSAGACPERSGQWLTVAGVATDVRQIDLIGIRSPRSVPSQQECDEPFLLPPVTFAVHSSTPGRVAERVRGEWVTRGERPRQSGTSSSIQRTQRA
jgi:hypothetical protein